MQVAEEEVVSTDEQTFPNVEADPTRMHATVAALKKEPDNMDINLGKPI